MKSKVRLNIPNTDRFWMAYILPTKEEMYEAVEEFKEEKTDRDYGAIVCPFEKYTQETNYEQEENLMGMVFFHEECLGAGVVSHEMLHVAINCERRLNGNKYCVLGPEVSDEEEWVAHLLTSLCDQFVGEVYGD